MSDAPSEAHAVGVSAPDADGAVSRFALAETVGLVVLGEGTFGVVRTIVSPPMSETVLPRITTPVCGVHVP
ncbi:hypothetical protein [Streptomyces marokkonensis]|uniref:hypothetical protein n=1 Tax=Streptomyces marokkonensis TaxID=324855 RepID=UPI0031E9C76D